MPQVTVRPMHLTFYPPSEVAMVATAFYVDGEDHPTIELAVYWSNFDPGDSDGRMTGESNFGRFKVRRFSPGSGCAVIIEDQKIRSTEDGLQNFIGKRAVLLRLPERTDLILVVWNTDDFNLAARFEREVLTDQLRNEIIRKMDALTVAFT